MMKGSNPANTEALYRTFDTPTLRSLQWAFQADRRRAIELDQHWREDSVKFCDDRLAIIAVVLAGREGPSGVYTQG